MRRHLMAVALLGGAVSCGASDARPLANGGHRWPTTTSAPSPVAGGERDPLPMRAVPTTRASRGRTAERGAPKSAPRPPSRTEATPLVAQGSARASWYARGSRTANGERFDPDGATFAHRNMSFGTRVRFCRDGRCVVARCTDRGPAAWTGRDFDLSRGAFAAIAPLGAGVVTVTWGVVG